jgi:hypothetical protein
MASRVSIRCPEGTDGEGGGGDCFGVYFAFSAFGAYFGAYFGASTAFGVSATFGVSTGFGDSAFYAGFFVVAYTAGLAASGSTSKSGFPTPRLSPDFT